MIRIRFDTFTFDRITKGVKANLMEKLSHFGGTAGLFNGFTIICIFELLTFGIALLSIYCKYEKKESNSVEVEEIQKYRNEKAHGSNKKNIDDMSRNFEGLKKEASIKRTKIIENDQKLKTMETALRVQRDRINENCQKLKAKEKELTLQRSMIDEDTQTLEALENELKKKVDIVDIHVIGKTY